MSNPDGPDHRAGGADGAPTVVYAVTIARSAIVLLRGQLAVLRRHGYRVVLICSPDDGLAEFAAAEDVEVVPLSMTRGLASPADLRALVAAVGLLRRLRPAVVNLSTPKASLVVGLAARITGVPVRVYSLWGLRLEGEKPGSPRRSALWAAERLTGACATTVLCASEGLRRRAVSLRLVSTGRTRVLGRGSTNGVDLQRFRPASPNAGASIRAGLRLATGSVVIGFVGRLAADKGIAVLLEAFEIVATRHDARLLLVGEFDDTDPLPPGLRERVLADPRVTVTGMVDPSGWYAAMDIVALPSRREGLPNVLLEAAASGVPTVTTRATGCPDAVDEDASGLVVEVDDRAALTAALLRLAADPELRARMGSAGRTFVERHFDQTVVWDRIVTLYAELGAGPVPRDRDAVDGPPAREYAAGAVGSRHSGNRA